MNYEYQDFLVKYVLIRLMKEQCAKWQLYNKSEFSIQIFSKIINISVL